MKPLDIRDVAIIDAFPIYNCGKTALSVGCGEGRIDFHLANLGYRVYATDIKRHETWQEMPNLTFHQSDIFDLASFPMKEAPVVICSEVMEHLKEYKGALKNLLFLATVRLILTIPFKKSYFSSSHCNFWDDRESDEYKNVNEFISLCVPYSVSISKIRTKAKDVEMGQYEYLITVDKRQNFNKGHRK